jgi:secreted trypsin-like serine protease
LEFAGPQSSVLQHVTLNVVNYGNCTKNQICSFAANKDTCQSDSGGPLFLVDKSLLYVVGVVSYGVECARQTYRNFLALNFFFLSVFPSVAKKSSQFFTNLAGEINKFFYIYFFRII